MGHHCSSVRPQVVDVEVIELARRAIAPEIGDIDLAREPSLFQHLVERDLVLIAHGLGDAVRPEATGYPAYKKLRLINRISKRIAGVAEYDQIASLGHERR